MLSKEGKHWRLIKKSTKEEFCFLIGVENWAIELREKEFLSLYELLIRLNKQLNSIQDKLMDEELITLELEIIPWYAQLEGNKNEWSLRFVFESEDETRSFEMYWPIPIAKILFFEIRKMWESMH